MPGYLLDTSVISAFAPGKPQVAADVGEWLLGKTHELFLPSVAIAEIGQGICRLHRNGGVQLAASLDRWLTDILRDYDPRILPLDAPAARLAGQLADRALAAGQHPGFADIAIAGQGGLTILTRNIRHFAALGAAHFDPFDPASRT